MRPPQEQTPDEWLVDYAGEKVMPVNTPTVTAPVCNALPSNDDHDEGVVEEKALIPAGKYHAIYLDHVLQPNFKGYGDKLVVSFTVTKAVYTGEIVNGFYNVRITNNGFSAKGGSRWVREMRQLFPDRKRKDRLPPSLLKNRNILVEVRTVTTGRGKRILDQTEQYSVVSNILGLLD